MYRNYHLAITEYQNEKLINAVIKANEISSKRIYRSNLFTIALNEFIKQIDKDDTYLKNVLKEYLLL